MLPTMKNTAHVCNVSRLRLFLLYSLLVFLFAIILMHINIVACLRSPKRTSLMMSYAYDLMTTILEKPTKSLKTFYLQNQNATTKTNMTNF